MAWGLCARCARCALWKRSDRGWSYWGSLCDLECVIESQNFYQSLGSLTGGNETLADRLGLRGGRRMMMLGFASGGVVRILREVQKAVEQ